MCFIFVQQRVLRAMLVWVLCSLLPCPVPLTFAPQNQGRGVWRGRGGNVYVCVCVSFGIDDLCTVEGSTDGATLDIQTMFVEVPSPTLAQHKSQGSVLAIGANGSAHLAESRHLSAPTCI